jgi:hypothetical protein
LKPPHKNKPQQLTSGQAAIGGPCRFPLWARLKHSSSSDGIQPLVVSSQDLCKPAQRFQGAGHEADGDTAMTRRLVHIDHGSGRSAGGVLPKRRSGATHSTRCGFLLARRTSRAFSARSARAWYSFRRFSNCDSERSSAEAS